MKKYVFVLLSLLMSMSLFAQKTTVTGNVIDALDKEPMIGLTILEKGTTNGTITDFNGNYSLANISDDAVLVFSMLGYKTQEIKVSGHTVINVSMEESFNELDDVVVIGYGTVRKGDLTSSISTVKGEELKSLTSGNAMNSLQGKISGVQISSAGSPGATPRVIIRGVSTVNGSNPLYVVDGMPVGDNINFLDQNDIETMQVLKDASAAAIYGTRGSNGVVLITTKKGVKGDAKFTFTSSVGFQTLKKPDMAKASEYEYVQKARYINDGNEPRYNGIDEITDAQGTDWWDETMKNTALIHNYNLSFSGGTDKLIYSASIGYYYQHSQYEVGDWQKLNTRFTMEYLFNDVVKAGVDFAPRYENWRDTPELLGAIMVMDPTTPVMKPEKEWTDNIYDNYSRSNNSEVWNPVADMNRMFKKTNEYALLANPYVNIEPIKGLTFRTQFGVNARFRMSDEFIPAFNIHSLERAEFSTAKREQKSWVDWNWTNTLTYMKTFDAKHNLTAMGGYTMERFQHYFLMGSRENTPTNDKLLHYVNAGTMNPQAEGIDEYSSLISYLGRVMYNYDNKYYVTASVRVDGSSKFPTGNKYATFPAVSLAWRVTGENFMKDQRIFDDLKIRGGWGRVGNQAIDNTAYYSTIEGGDYVFGNSGDREIGTAVSSIGNRNIKWETVEDISIGVDMTLLNNRLTLTADWFKKESKDMLLKKDNLLISGYPMWNAQMWENIGTMDAKGWEFSADWKDNVRDFNYQVGINLSSVKNKAGELSGQAITSGEFKGDYAIKNDMYGEISRFYGYIVDGIFQNQTEINSHTDEKGNLLQPDAKPGDLRFKDLNGDGKLTEQDKTWIGKGFPDLMIGLNINLAYKGVDFATNFYGTIGNDIFNTTMGRYSGAGGENVYAGTYNKVWHGEGTSTTLPRLTANDANMNYSRPSSFFVEKGSYFRCKQLQIGYTFPKSLTKNTKLRVSFSAQNLFTITGYSGMDPEAAAAGDKVLETGIDWVGYPNPRTYLFGLNLNF